MNTLKSVLAVALVAICVVNVSYGEQIAVTPTAVNVINNGPFALGWAFTVNQDISVTSLGAFDILGDGYYPGQQVRLYDSSNDTILVTAAIDGSATVEAVGGYDVYFQSITPLTLTTGIEYVVAASEGWHNDIMNSLTITPGAAIDPVSSRATLFDANLPASVGGFAIQGTDPQDLYMGANFKYNPVPEPSTMVLLAMGLLSIMLYARQK